VEHGDFVLLITFVLMSAVAIQSSMAQEGHQICSCIFFGVVQNPHNLSVVKAISVAFSSNQCLTKPHSVCQVSLANGCMGNHAVGDSNGW